MRKGEPTYRFFAGRLRGKTPRECTDKQLKWALAWNRDYISKHTDPLATVKYQGRFMSVGMLPEGVADRHIAMGMRAMQECERELTERRKTSTHESGAMEPRDLVNMARITSTKIVCNALEELADSMRDTASVMSRHAVLLEDLAESLLATLPPGGM